MKKTVSILIIVILLMSLFSCSVHDSGDTKRIVCTGFAYYDWVRTLLSGVDGAEAVQLLRGNADMHSYQATADDIILLLSADLVVMSGGSSETWVSDALSGSRIETVSTLDLLGSDAIHDEHDHGHEETEHEQADEHVWLSVKNAVRFLPYIADKLSKLLPESTETITANMASYISELKRLDGEYASAVESAGVKQLVFCDRFPFAYLCGDYNIDYIAAFDGCSADTEASFETVLKLADAVDSGGIKSVCIIDGSDADIANVVISNTKSKNAQILVLDSMQSEEDTNRTYVEIMAENLNVVKTALEVK